MRAQEPQIRPKRQDEAIRAVTGAREEIVFGMGESSLGHVLVACSANGVVSILVGEAPHRLIDDLEGNFPDARVVHEDRDCADLVAQVVGYIEKPRRTFDVTLDMRGTPFQQLVWKAVQKGPAGQTSNYSEIARAIGRPKAMRAVGTACANSRFAIAVPCHRVLHKDGSPSGGSFWFGEHQRELLDREAKSALIPRRSASKK